MSTNQEKTVHVRSYQRTRFGNEESVVQHWRRHPS